MIRYATVRARSLSEVRAYLPENYTVFHTSPNPSGVHVVIGGKDDAGWTLDGYVLPRLASGLIYGREYPTYEAAVEAAAAVMN